MFNQRKLVGIGSPIVDVIASISQRTIDKFSIPLGGTELATNKHDDYYKLLANCMDFHIFPGGTVMNSIRVCTVLS